MGDAHHQVQCATYSKAKVEAGVLLVERWILARLRKQTFFSLGELNREIRRLLEWLNERPFQKLEGSRRSLFESLERPALRPLPEQPYEFARWKKVRVNIDYHVAVDGHYYSAPYTLAGEQLDARITSTMVELLHGGRRVAAHPRSQRRGQFTTEASHRPRAHQKYLAWTPERITAWAEKTGPHTAELARQILESRAFPEQGYRACLGLLRLGKQYSPERLEAACERALRMRAISFRSVNSILQNGLDRLPAGEPPALELPQNHENVRGGSYYAVALNGDTAC